MKKPLEIDQLSYDLANCCKGPYPPNGFLPVDDASLGNGDCFGLYWLFGYEIKAPIICEMIHDEGRIQPMFSSISLFIKWLDENNWEWGEPVLADETFSPYYYDHAKKIIKENQLDNAVPLLKHACNMLPEVSEYWTTYASQLRRQNKQEEYFIATLNAYLSNWVFGLPAIRTLANLQRAKEHELFCNNPVVKRSTKLTMSFGGTKENSNYPLLLECVDEYFAMEQPVIALILLHNYAYMMCAETSAFQQRYNFDLIKWQTDFSILCKKYLADNRRFESS